MATMLITPKGVKRFNSYYLAVVEKNKLLKKGMEVKLVDQKNFNPNSPSTRDCNLRTVYNYNEQKALNKLRRGYDPIMFGDDYRESKKRKK